MLKKKKNDYNLIKEPVSSKHAAGSVSSSYGFLSCVFLFLLPDIQSYNRELVCEMILADLSWHPPDIWWLPVAKKHTSQSGRSRAQSINVSIINLLLCLSFMSIWH